MTSPSRVLITCIGVDHDLDMLPHFLRHYLALGIRPGDFHVILNSRHAETPGLARATEILSQAGIPPDSAEPWIARYTSEAMWEKRREVQRRVCAPEDWVISADVDEFHFYPEALDAFLARCEKLDVDCVQGVFIDRLAEGGALAPVRETPDLLSQFPIEAEVGLSIAGTGVHHRFGGTIKMMAMRGHVMPGRGGHGPLKGQKVSHLYIRPLGEFPEIGAPDFRFAVPTRVAHVHWTASLPQRLRDRLDTPGVSEAGAEYGRKQLDHIERHDGIAIDKVALAAQDWPGDWTTRLSALRKRGKRLALKKKIGKKLSKWKRKITGASS